MEIAKQESILVISRDSSDIAHRVRIVSSHTSVLQSWGPATRVSPIWGVKEYGTSESIDYRFPREKHLLFLGPINPLTVAAKCSRKSKVWLSMGLYNVIVLAASAAEAAALRTWADTIDRKISWEHWCIKNGRLQEVFVSEPVRRPLNWQQEVVAVAQAEVIPELREIVREYCALMASAVARAEQVSHELVGDLLKVNKHVSFLLSSARTTRIKNGGQYRLYGQLLTINTGLSRFNSQTFAGTSLITETECHFRYNSLLGIGVATLALWRLRSFLDDRLGTANIPERVAALKNVSAPHGDLGLIPMRDRFWSTSHLDAIQTDDLPQYPLVPLLTYFSARDGFRSTTSTISAPLASVGACNSVQWSLMTITHEISHTVVHNVLAKLIPNFSVERDVRFAYDLFTRKRAPSNLFEEFQRHFYVTVVAMDRNEHPEHKGQEKSIFDTTLEEFSNTIQSWALEVEEIMVHVFDFMYFYGHDPDRYIRGIWVSWGTIPTIKARVNEYVVRTVCAVLAANFSQGKEPEKLARKTVLNTLRAYISRGNDAAHIKQAIEYLEGEWENEIKDKIKVRRELVKMAAAFLFSELVATDVRGETKLRSKASEHEGYDLDKLVLKQSTIDNPLRFLEVYTNSDQPSLAESLWMFLILAFFVSPDAKQ